MRFRDCGRWVVVRAARLYIVKMCQVSDNYTSSHTPAFAVHATPSSYEYPKYPVVSGHLTSQTSLDHLGPKMAANGDSPDAEMAGDSRDPSGFLSEIIGAPVTVKLNSGIVYKGK
jgi:hypothetical protein